MIVETESSRCALSRRQVTPGRHRQGSYALSSRAYLVTGRRTLRPRDKAARLDGQETMNEGRVCCRASRYDSHAPSGRSADCLLVATLLAGRGSACRDGSRQTRRGRPPTCPFQETVPTPGCRSACGANSLDGEAYRSSEARAGRGAACLWLMLRETSSRRASSTRALGVPRIDRLDRRHAQEDDALRPSALKCGPRAGCSSSAAGAGRPRPQALSDSVPSRTSTGAGKSGASWGVP